MKRYIPFHLIVDDRGMITTEKDQLGRLAGGIKPPNMIGHFINHVGVRSEHQVFRKKKKKNRIFFLIDVPRVDQLKTSSK